MYCEKCSYLNLIKGTEKLIKDFKTSKFDYFIIKCGVCKKDDEYIHDISFIECDACHKITCRDCNFDLVYLINTAEKCSCENPERYILCKDINHFYCDKCEKFEKCNCGKYPDEYCVKCCFADEKCPICYLDIIKND